MPAIISLNDFKSQLVLSPSTWIVEYNDNTHLENDTYIKLGRIEVEEVSPDGTAYYSFLPTAMRATPGETAGAESDCLEAQLKEAWKITDTGKKEEIEAGKRALNSAPRIIIDQLIEATVRLGLVPVEFEINDSDFSKKSYATVIFDTNALRDGSIRHLKEQFPYMQLWTTIPVVSLMEIGERTESIRSRASKGTDKNKHTLIRVRAQATVAPQEIKWIKDNFPHETLELAPELLRTFRGFEKDNDPDRSSINDRLILECIKDMRRQRGLPKGVYLMSGDKGVSRLAQLEGLQTIYPARPDPENFTERIYSARYSLGARAFIVCSMHRLLWDLAHVFSKVRTRCTSGSQAGQSVELFYYYPTKLVNDWMDDKLEVSEIGPSSPANAV